MTIPKSYRYYKLSDLKSLFGVTVVDVAQMLEPVTDISPSEVLRIVLERNMHLPMKNEKAKSELLVMPILAEVWYINQNFKPLSGLTFNVLAEKGLKGVCDFLISNNPNASEIESPIVCIFEAKDDNIENWYGQCGAEMYAAKLFNRQEGNDIQVIHGAVTNGFVWQFLKLENDKLHIDTQRYGTVNLPQLLGAIQKVYDFYK
ncbi:MAG: hypothetical protein ACKVTZ_11570 [Bacteroidia bacterium]